SVVHAVGEPRAGLAVAIDTVEAAVGELDVPVVAVGGRIAPPSLFERPRTGGDADVAGDGRGGVGGERPQGGRAVDRPPHPPPSRRERGDCLLYAPPARPAGAGRARREGRARRAAAGARTAAPAARSRTT